MLSCIRVFGRRSDAKAVLLRGFWYPSYLRVHLELIDQLQFKRRFTETTRNLNPRKSSGDRDMSEPCSESDDLLALQDKDTVGFDPADLSWDRGGLSKETAMSPLYTLARKLIDENKGCICLIQVGGFYELYFEQASDIGPKLGIKVAARKALNTSVPMAGFPLYQLQKFVKILVHDLQMNVAIVDQFDNIRNDTDLKHRKISRIVSPGTLVDESFMNYSKNNYLVGLSPGFKPGGFSDQDLPIGVAWIDISVGEFFVQQTTLGELAGDLRRINPSEIILPKDYHVSESPADLFANMADLKKYFVRYHKTTYKDYKLHFQKDILSTRKALEEFNVREEAAMNLVLSYVNVNLPERELVLDQPSKYINTNYLAMDSRTRDALELTGRSTFGSISVVGSLLNTIKRTKTASGSRLLSQWILLPVLDEKILEKRLNFVSLFKNNVFLTREITTHLQSLGDMVRSLQKLALRSGPSVTHLLSIATGLVQLDQLKSMMKNATNSLDKEEAALVERFVADLTIPDGVAQKILETINIENQPVSDSDPSMLESDLDPNSVNQSTIEFTVNKNYNETLASQHEKLRKLREKETRILTKVLRVSQSIDAKASVDHRTQSGRHTDAVFVKCRTKFINEVQQELISEIDADIREKRKGNIVMKTTKWSNVIEARNELTQNILDLEKKIIEELSLEVLSHISTIRTAGRSADFIDVTSSFGTLARENSWVRPRFASTKILSVVEGRHVVVESSLKEIGKSFVPNDTKLGSEGTLWIISGPNMGGKSTYLRQNALIVILAQIGCFVPAKRANVCIVDRLFTRVGASDDIFSDLSTFMVEMIETSNILKNATSRSLAIVDEIGRGTSGKEGLAIAYATLLHLLEVNKCRTLFATHFGKELKSLLDKDNIKQAKVRFYKTQVMSAPDGKHTFQHTLEPGISERSYAIEVAELAGFPKSALSHAQRALTHM